MLSFELAGGEPAVEAFLDGTRVLHPGRIAGRGREPDRASGEHDSCRHGGIGARCARASAPGCCACRWASRMPRIWSRICRRGLERAAQSRSQHRISGGTRRNGDHRRRARAAARSAGRAPDSMAREHRGFDGARLGLQLQRIAQQHRGAQDRGIGIGDAAAGDVGRGAMNGLEQPAARRRRPSEAEGSSPSEPASMEASSVRMSPNMFSVTMTSKSRGRFSRCMAAESTSMCSKLTSGNSAGMMRSTTRAPQARGLEHIGLVDRGQFAAARRAPGRAARRTTRSISATRVAADIDGLGGGARLLAEIDAARQFAHHHDVDAVQQLGLDGRGVEHRGVRDHRPQVGEQPERLAQLQQSLFGANLAHRPAISGRPPRPAGWHRRARASASVAAGSGSPGRVDGGAAEQRRFELESMCRNAPPPRSSARTASAVTSPPMPSPASTAISAFTWRAVTESPSPRALRSARCRPSLLRR